MRIRMLVVALLIVAAMVLTTGLMVCAAFSLSQPASNPSAQSAPPDTARLYFPPQNTTDFTNLYAVIGRLPLEQWHSIRVFRVFGEEFSACALGYDGGETLLTVDPEEMQRCGPLPG
jgi:hypothetical protein